MPKLDWLTRNEDEKVSARVPYRLLEAVPEHSYGDPNAENMLIQGDNLDALKALLPFYAGRVKCIFIDPPYNTRSAFEHYDDNLEHTQWLGMMYPRLELLRDLLAEDGSIWVTIDDNEAHYLKVIMDEVFGRKNFAATIVWEKRTTRENRRVFSFKHDHVLIYAKDKSIFEQIRNPLEINDAIKARYSNPDNDPRGPWQSVSANAMAGHGTPSQFYALVTPSGRKLDPPPGRCWLYTQERMKEEIAHGNIWFGKNGSGVPRVKRFFRASKDTGLTPETIWNAAEVGTNDEAKKETNRIFEVDSLFDTPKPERLIARVIHIASNPADIVLDSFLGSGTTAAVAHKMGRRYIGIEMGEHAITHCVPRLKKVVDGEQGGISEAVGWKGGGGFHFYKLGSPVFDEEGRINPAVRFAHLAAHVWFAETRTPLPRHKMHQGRRSPLLGVHEGVGYYLLFNGILGDKRPDGGNVLTRRLLAELPAHDGPKVIYGESSRLSRESLLQLGITFKQTPYDVKAR
jgi:adenine-specific DNA-methyltransferase